MLAVSLSFGSAYCAVYNVARGHNGDKRTVDIIFGWDKKLKFISSREVVTRPGAGV